MTDETGGYRIGIKDIYTQIVELSARLDKITNDHSIQIASMQSQQETLRHAMREMWTRIDKNTAGIEQQGRDFNTELDKRGDKQWQSSLSIVAIIISLIAAIAPLVVK